VSQAIGDRRLLPQVRNAGAGALIIANGFSCREQIAQSTDRLAMHLADVLAVAKRQPATESAGTLERTQVRDYSAARLPLSRVAGALLVLAGVTLAMRMTRQRARRSPQSRQP